MLEEDINRQSILDFKYHIESQKYNVNSQYFELEYFEKTILPESSCACDQTKHLWSNFLLVQLSLDWIFFTKKQYIFTLFYVITCT